MTDTTLSSVLDEVEQFLLRYVYFEDAAQPTAVTLWIAGTYVFDAYDTTPYLHIKSPEKRSGKSLLLEILELLCSEPLLAANVSPAALYRVVQERRPTLLHDEVDAVFPKGRSTDSSKEDLRGLLNAGFRASARTVRVNLKAPRDKQIEEFSVYCPKALAGIGDLPDTIADRCIVIALQRKPPRIRVERFRRRVVEELAADLRSSIADATDGLVDRLRSMHPNLPHALNDRQQDVWELLLAVADVAGPKWSESARLAAVTLSGQSDASAESFGQELLRDLFTIWGDDEEGGVPSQELCDRLAAMPEARWGDLYGRPINQRDLARFLKPYGVTSQSVKWDAQTLRGYRREHLWPIWERYLNAPSTTGAIAATTQTAQAPTPSSASATDPLLPLPGSTRSTQVADAVSGDSPDTARDVAPVAEVAQGMNGSGSVDADELAAANDFEAFLAEPFPVESDS